MGMYMRKINQKKLDLRLRGYYKSFRGSFLLLKNKTLTTQEYVLWHLSFDVLADWDTDPSRLDTFGSFPHNNREIAYYLGWSPSNVSRHSQKLYKLGLWRKKDDGRVEVGGFAIIKMLTKMTHKHIVNLQDFIANPQIYDAFLNHKNEILHNKSIKENTITYPKTDADLHSPFPKEPLISSKDESNVSFVKKVIVTGNVRSIEEYQKMYEENGSTGMSPEDMRDIDESLSVTHEVTGENEKLLVDTFFDGDWEKYKKNVYYGKKDITKNKDYRL